MSENDGVAWPPAPQVQEAVVSDGGRLPFTRGLKVFSIMTLSLGALPYPLYIPARFLGAPPSEQVWDAGGANGGPWGLEPVPSVLICGPMFLLPFLALLTLCVFGGKAFEHRRWVLAALGAGMGVVQLGLALLQLCTVFWAVE